MSFSWCQKGKLKDHAETLIPQGRPLPCRKACYPQGWKRITALWNFTAVVLLMSEKRLPGEQNAPGVRGS